MNRRRLDAEALRDSLLMLSGRLDLRCGGPPDQDATGPRRMLYVRNFRENRSGLGAIFDGAYAAIHVDKRTASTVAPQALFLMNAPLVVDQLEALVARPDISAANEPQQKVQQLYRLLYGRAATPVECELARDFLAHLDNPKSPAAMLGPWETYAQALLLSNEYLFVD